MNTQETVTRYTGTTIDFVQLEKAGPAGEAIAQAIFIAASEIQHVDRALSRIPEDLTVLAASITEDLDAASTNLNPHTDLSGVQANIAARFTHVRHLRTLVTVATAMLTTTH